MRFPNLFGKWVTGSRSSNRRAAKRAAHCRGRQPVVEPLEQRTLLSVWTPQEAEPIDTGPVQTVVVPESAALESPPVSTSWFDGSGPSAYQNLDWASLTPTAAALEVVPGEVLPGPTTGGFHVYVENGLLASIQTALNTYVADVGAEGYTVAMEEFSGTAAQLRADLQTEWTTNSLEGALFVGDLPHVNFTSEDNFDDPGVQVTYPHDLYFMDLDGTYVLNATGLDEHTDGSGDVEPEIYVSRITTGNMGGLTGKTEAALINEYFAKVHSYRSGALQYENRGLMFVDDDWVSHGAGDMDGLYSEVLVINDLADTTREGYLDDTLPLNYESILEFMHSAPTYHQVKTPPTRTASISTTPRSVT